jgi:hypothetical protein
MHRSSRPTSQTSPTLNISDLLRSPRPTFSPKSSSRTSTLTPKHKHPLLADPALVYLVEIMARTGAGTTKAEIAAVVAQVLRNPRARRVVSAYRRPKCIALVSCAKQQEKRRRVGLRGRGVDKEVKKEEEEVGEKDKDAEKPGFVLSWVVETTDQPLYWDRW